MIDYVEFLKNKVAKAERLGFDISPDDVHPLLKPHQRASVVWAIQGGRRALFEAFGLGKTIMQLEIVRLTRERAGGMGLIVMPLGVRQEFMRDAEKLGIQVKFIRRIEEADDPEGIYLTNYETIRDGKMDPQDFAVASLDEASCLRGFGGTKTFREFMALFAGDRKTLNERTQSRGVQYRFVATATPSPNDYIELLAYSAYLGIMDVSAAKTRFFKRDSTKADHLTIHPHKVEEFWMWVSTWALFVQKPSDLGFENTGYDLPDMKVHWHEVATDHTKAGREKNGQCRMFANAARGVQDSAREKRVSMGRRIEQLRALIAGTKNGSGAPSDQIVVWVDLNDEQRAVEKMLNEEGVSFSSLYGSQAIDEREVLLEKWRNHETTVFLSKPMMYGAGVNLQQCHTMIYLGVGFKFYEVFQGIHRIHRFLQDHPCDIHFIYTQAERLIRKNLETKWVKHKEMVDRMSDIISEYGLSVSAMASHLTKSIGVDRIEVSGKRYRLVNNDCVLETRAMQENSVGLILTSIPFSSQYEYSPNYSDFGHSDNNAAFWSQMDYLIPELFRVLMPGRIAAIHVKDRIVPGGMTGLGFQTVYPLHMDCHAHFLKHGYGYMGMKTIVTDVVRENNQTYRLGWTEQCKDGTKMGVGMPEYLMLFRKPPSETDNSYADLPVVKTKDKYSRSRWQIDAHGFSRSSGDRLMDSEELRQLKHDEIFKLFRDYSLNNVYDFEHHVKIGETLDLQGRLPVTFMLLQPQSWSPDVWTDITRMLTLNSSQYSAGRQMHLCPMQLDLADRAIEQWSMEGETVYDPFAGLGTVPMRAILKRRFGLGCELSTPYFLDACGYCKMADQDMASPTIFDLIQEEKKRLDGDAIPCMAANQ